MTCLTLSGVKTHRVIPTSLPRYKLSFYKNFPGGAAVAYLTFSQPVDNTTVSIDGVTLLPTSSDTTLQMTTDLSITMNQNLFDLKVKLN